MRFEVLSLTCGFLVVGAITHTTGQRLHFSRCQANRQRLKILQNKTPKKSGPRKEESGSDTRAAPRLTRKLRQLSIPVFTKQRPHPNPVIRLN